MSTSPLGPEDIRAAAEVHRELPPEYSDAVVAAFIERVDRAVAARVEARLAANRPARPVKESRSLMKGIAIGVCAGALAVAGLGVGVLGNVAGVNQRAPAPVVVPHVHHMPAHARPPRALTRQP
ncbi:MAG TPA: hypothetical protein VEV61_15015 [Streptosporangiaceae bacterium]|nr:hypothetical protein [Streptosporangiaceae bacterium]